MSAAPGISTAESAAFTYDVFISYSRKDLPFVDALVKVLQEFSPPKGLGLAPRRLNIFLDRHDFQTGDYQERLNQYLKQSSKLILICSPSARLSGFVNEEIKTFAAFRGGQHVIPVLIAGIPNNEATRPDDQLQAFPEQLCNLMSMPNAIDYRNFSPPRDRADRGRFADSWFTILAAIYDRSRAEIELREQRRRQKRQRVYLASVAAVVALAVLFFAVALPRFRLESALAAVSEAGGSVEDKDGYVTVTLLTAAKAANVDNVLAKLAVLPRVDSLDLASCSFASPSLAHLNNIRGLHRLTVANTALTDDGMAYIAKLHGLTSLELDGTNLTDKGLLSLDQFPHLGHLSLIGLKLNAAILAKLASCRGLKDLYLDRCELDDRSLSYLGQLQDLNNLSLDDNQIKGGGLACLRQMHSLKVLSLADTPLTDAGLLHVGSVRSLESLFLSATQITNPGLRSLAGLSKLQSLVLQNNQQIADPGVQLLGNLPALRELWVGRTSVADATMHYAAQQRGLQILAAPVTSITDAGASFLAELPDLRELYLGGDSITDDGALALIKIQTLRKLYLPSARLTDHIFPQFKLLPKLQELSVGGPGVTKEGFAHLKASLPGVKVLLDEAPSN